MKITIKNARQHNLKNIDLSIPRNKLVVFTGVSGSGKSSLVFDTIYAEAYRQFLNSLSTKAQKYLPKLNRPQADEISGLSPAIIVDQKKMGTNPRSTVGTVTEVYTYLRLLFSRCGSPLIGGSTLFSFNTPEGACSVCKGLGEELVLDQNRLIDWNKSLAQGAIRHPEYRVGGRRWHILRISRLFEMNKLLKDFTEEKVDRLLYSQRIGLSEKDDRGFVQNYGFEGIVTGIKRRRLDKRGTSYTTTGRDSRYFKLVPCPTCQGSRLNEKARSVTVGEKTITDLVSIQLTDLKKFLESIKNPVAKPIVDRIDELLGYLIDIGVGYLSLNRPVGTLSGGEAQRVKMAKQLGSNLVELIYVLDEPSIGLHPKDIASLTVVLEKLRDQGNTVLVVEHDPAIIQAADQIIDLGPGAGTQGGKVIFQGPYEKLITDPASVTGQAIKKKQKGPKKNYRRPTGFLSIDNASLHNLKNISVDIPTGVFVCVTGVAGAGKSTLVNDVLVKQHSEAIIIDQSAVSRSVRSNPATYIGTFDLIRKLFSQETGKKVSLFSFNSQGACSKCRGLGFQKIEMHFLGYVHLTCDACQGKQYSPGVLSLKYKGRNIADVLEMTVDQAFTFFDNPEIRKKLAILREVGLDYLTLGQSVDTLSGGEAQRIKITRELNKKGQIYVFDEPTTGLHINDIQKLLKVINRLVDSGNTVIVIEHNLDIISNSDWIIDLGPEGGEKGGKIIAKGRPEEIMKTDKSHTGKYLKRFFGG